MPRTITASFNQCPYCGQPHVDLELVCVYTDMTVSREFYDYVAECPVRALD